MALREGDLAPDIAGDATSGERISLQELRGRTVLLKFLRFAACPICSLHLREYVRRHDELVDAGITTVAVYHSPVHKIDERLERLDVPFGVVADPDKTAFDAYAVGASIRGMLTRRVMRDYVQAMRAGFFSRPLGHEGGIQGHPADFLIDGGGVIRLARYGRDYADTLSVGAVLTVAVDRGLADARPVA